ncbi:hypothetical protein [Pannonibacter carbonis]|uniref:hypothetical protein n=1 Tax=Pannonibacter carbonis TaxID=2067569 RepID=UPI001300930B|nr:hypothetical protein [Pannonibacter carbonis]
MYRYILSETYTLVAGNIGVTLRIAGAWMAIGILLSVGEAFTQGTWIGTAFSLTAFIWAFLSYASIATAWHRFGLLQERPGLIHLRFGRLELKVLGRIWLATIASLPALILIVTLIFSASWVLNLGLNAFYTKPSTSSFIAFLVIILISSYFYFRYCFVIPASAINHRIRLSKSFEMTRKIALLITIIGILTFIPSAVCYWASYDKAFLIGIFPHFLEELFSITIRASIDYLGMSVVLAAVTVAYRRAIETLWAENPNDPVFVGS